MRNFLLFRYAGPTSYSDISEHCGAIGDYEHTIITSLDSVLSAVATKRPGMNELESSKFILKGIIFHDA